MKKRKRAEEEEKEKESKEETRPARDTTRSISDIRVQAGDIEKKVLAFCLDPSKKVNTEQTATIMRYFKDMRGIVEELLLHNSYLTGKLEQCTGSVKDKQILSAVNKSQQVSKRLETAVKKTAKAEPKQPTYAEKVRVINTKIGQLVVKPPRNVIIIRSEDKEGEIKTSEEAKEADFALVNPRKKGIQVTAVRKIGGNGLVVETANRGGIKAFTENTKLKEAGLKASTPQRRLPRIIAYDVPRAIPEKEILVCMRKHNQDRLNEEDIAAIKFCFRTGRKDAEETNWLMKVPPPQVRESS